MLTDKDCADLCAACYWTPNTFDKVVDVSGVWAGIKQYPDCTAIAFRGSTTFFDWVRDFQGVMIYTPLLGGVEQGFYAGMMDAVNAITPSLPQNHRSQLPLFITGHSLGAAHAFIFAAELIKLAIMPAATVVFGCPRPGSETLKSIITGSKMVCRSYKNRIDPVTDVPPEVPFIFPYEEDSACIPIDVAPQDGDPWGPFADHHIQLYQQGAPDTVCLTNSNQPQT